MKGPTGSIFDLKLVGMFYVRGKKQTKKNDTKKIKESVLTKKAVSNLVFYAQSTITVISGGKGHSRANQNSL